MHGKCLNFDRPIQDGISRIRFAPKSNNLLISSWDSSLRLYDVDSFTLRVEAPSEAALLDCCFQNEGFAFSAGSDGGIRSYDLDSGMHDTIGIHDDIASCIGYSDETSQLVSSGWDNKICFWDIRSKGSHGSLKTPAEVESMFVSGFHLMIAVRSSVNIFDSRNYNKSVYAKDLCFGGNQIKCVRPILNVEGFMAGSVDGRIAVEYLNLSNEGYVFWCHSKLKEGRHHVVAVNDIASSPLVSSTFVTGDNKGCANMWDAQIKRRALKLPTYSNSIASLSYNHDGRLLAIASSYTYRQGDEKKEPPQIYIREMDDICPESVSAMKSE